jgi:hypothetical protein
MPPKYVQVYYKQLDQTSYKCLVCPNVSRKKSGTSWANLLSHLNDKHGDWEVQVENVLAGASLDCYVDKEGIYLIPYLTLRHKHV